MYFMRVMSFIIFPPAMEYGAYLNFVSITVQWVALRPRVPLGGTPYFEWLE